MSSPHTPQSSVWGPPASQAPEERRDPFHPAAAGQRHLTADAAEESTQRKTVEEDQRERQTRAASLAHQRAPSAASCGKSQLAHEETELGVFSGHAPQGERDP